MTGGRPAGRAFLGFQDWAVGLVVAAPIRLRYALLLWIFRRIVARNYDERARVDAARILARALALHASESRQLAGRYFDQLAAGYAFSVALALQPQRRGLGGLLQVEGLEDVSSDPALFFVSHMSAYQSTAIYLARQFGGSASLTLRDAIEHFRATSQIGGANLVDILEQQGATLIGVPSLYALREVEAAFDNRVPVVSAIDANSATPDSPVMSGFMEYACPVQTGLIALAQRKGAKVFFGEMTRQSGALGIFDRFRLTLTHASAFEAKGEAKAATDAVFAALKDRVLARPDQWALWRYYDQFTDREPATTQDAAA